MLALEGVACLRGGRLLFEGLDLTLAAGEAALVTGENGAGKSSLLRILAGLLGPSAGRIVREGAVALAAEAAGLDEGWPLERALGFWARLDDAALLRHPGPVRSSKGRRLGRHSRHPELVSGSTSPLGPAVGGARWMLKRVQHDDRSFDGIESPLQSAMRTMGIDALARVPVRMLSTGQRKRAVLARTIASGAPIWLLDEPANGLDVGALDRLGDAIAAHRAAGGIVVVASHQPIGLADPKRVAL